MPGSDAIGTIVRHALQRAQVDAPHRGSHQFRHALAVRMLQAGASLGEIGEVLRHQSLRMPDQRQLVAAIEEIDRSAAEICVPADHLERLLPPFRGDGAIVNAAHEFAQN
jgi:integrase